MDSVIFSRKENGKFVLAGRKFVTQISLRPDGLGTAHFEFFMFKANCTFDHLNNL